MNSANCEITGKTLIKSNWDFVPKSNKPLSVTTFKISSSIIPKISSSICESFPNLTKIVAREISLEIVDEDAFVACLKLKEIDLEKNYITKLEKNTFNRNPTLIDLQLWLNRIQELDVDLFENLGSITTIDLSSNNLSYFPAEIVRDMKSIKTLSLCNNRILDLDVTKMLNLTPNLVTLNLRDNDLECSRLKEIQSDLFQRGLKVSTNTDTIRVRYYGIRKIDGVECVDKPTWETLKMIRHIGDARNETKRNLTEIGNEIKHLKEMVTEKRDEDFNEQKTVIKNIWICLILLMVGITLVILGFGLFMRKVFLQVKILLSPTIQFQNKDDYTVLLHA